MRYVAGTLILMTILLVASAEGIVNEGTSQNANDMQGEKTELLDRIDFGNAFIMGQTIKSGAVYLLKRKKSDIKSMLKNREDFREEILEDFSVETLKGMNNEE
jgi:hypothetical protein